MRVGGTQILNFLRFEGGGLGLDLLVLREEGAMVGPLGVREESWGLIVLGLTKESLDS